MNVCCASQHQLKHMSQVKDLQQEFDTNHILSQLRSNNQQVINDVCISCISREKRGLPSRREKYNLKPIDTNNKINYLELTTSNICNQTCSTCSSVFSSKWAKLDKEANEQGIDFRQYHKSQFLSDADVQKIFPILDNLQLLTLKGGEPFADKNNLLFIDRLSKTNPNCIVDIVSNLYKIPDEYIPLLRRLQNIKIKASIDGTDDLYYWIRSVKFNDTVKTMENIYQQTGIKVSIYITVSLYNIFNISDIIKFFSKKEYVRDIVITNVVNSPNYCSPLLLEKFWEKYVYQNLDGMWHINGMKIIKNIFDEKSLYDDDRKQRVTKQALQWIKFMNKQRGMDIFDIVPELRSCF